MKKVFRLSINMDSERKQVVEEIEKWLKDDPDMENLETYTIIVDVEKER